VLRGPRSTPPRSAPQWAGRNRLRRPLSGRCSRVSRNVYWEGGGGADKECRKRSWWYFSLVVTPGALRCWALPSWAMSAAVLAEPLGPGSFAKRVLVTGGAGFM
jgi:hypothetical protein